MKVKRVKFILGRAEALETAEECGRMLKERFGGREVYLFGLYSTSTKVAFFFCDGLLACPILTLG